MRTSGLWVIGNLKRLASILATLVVGVMFAMVTSANAAPAVKKNEGEGKAKIEKIEKEKADVEEAEEAEEAEADAEADIDAEELEAEFLGK